MRRWLAAGLLAAAGMVCAQPAPEVKAPAKPAEAPQRVVIEGRAVSPDEERRNSTLAMTVVGRDELDAYGDSSILDVLQRLPGITLDGDAPRLRGMGGGYTLILLNGEPAPPGFSLDSLAPGEIERIEVIKGPTAEFGGVAGTINVILRSAPKTRQGEWRSNAGYRALGPQGGTSFSWGDRVGAVGLYLPVAASNWANASGYDTARVSRSSSGERIEQRVEGRDRMRGGGINLAPRLDWKVDDTRTLNWQAFLQRNESDNRSQRSTLALAGPPPFTLQDASSARGVFELARTQAQWVDKQPDGRRWELKGSAQASHSHSASTSQGQDAAGINRPQRDSLNSQRTRSWLAPIWTARTAATSAATSMTASSRSSAPWACPFSRTRGAWWLFCRTNGRRCLRGRGWAACVPNAWTCAPPVRPGWWRTASTS